MKEPDGFFEGLRESYNKYFDVLENGCNDPFWSDGANINLCAGHFYYYKERVKEKYPGRAWACLDWIHETLLAEVPHDYMARPGEIRAGALKALAAFEADGNLAAVRELVLFVSKKERDEAHADNVIGYYKDLKAAIEGNDLVTMRCYGDYESYLESFRDCADSMRKADLGLFGL
ncbi:MAG: hypothetical protein LBH73_00030 [Spirochaetaceae bacterium]|nr:hypothetical protein [Spirochaetaceae bacterium]